MFSANARINKRPEQLTSEIDDKVIILEVDSGQYFSFDEVSTDIWKRLDTTPQLADLCSALAKDYDADLETIQIDVYKLINMLVTNNLIEISE